MREDSVSSGADGGGVDWVASHPPLWGCLSLKLRKGTKTVTEVILSPIVPISFYQVSHPP